MQKEQFDQAFADRYPEEIREKLSAARVAIAGLGGLGSNIAVMLARSGIGNLLLVDFDSVDISNLNRQVYGISHIGKLKTQAIKEILYEINPYLNYEFVNSKVTQENVKEIFSNYDIVCEAFDHAENKALLVEELLTRFQNTIVISGNGMAGYQDANLIKTRKVLSRLYICGDMETGIESGVDLMSPRVTLCAAHQANKVIELILAK